LVDDGYRRIGDDPFATPEEERDPTRRLRGRLPAPVTVWTAADRRGVRSGLTVSSVLVVEGEPPMVLGLIGPETALWDAVQDSGRFTVHLMAEHQVRLADQFAGRYPGDPFEGVAASDGGFGPVLDEVGTRAGCELAGYVEAGYFLLVRGVVANVEFAGSGRPLVHYGGRYLTTGPRSR